MTRASMSLKSPKATLIEMLSYRRPAFSKTERRFIREYIRPLGVEEDTFGNLYKRIGDAPVLWSCHTDTVHNVGGIQTLSITNDTVRVADKASNCLGGDNTVGVWLMVEMIRQGVPGLYVFHRAEEIGGQGSYHIAETTPDLVAGIKFAIAFDRRGTQSIITHQAGGRCCSDAFATSLANALGLGHVHDDGGTFTDTASYMTLIGECTNVSAGFSNEHRATEKVDLAYVETLRESLLRFDWTALEYSRNPDDPDDDDYADLDKAWDIWGEVDQTPRRSDSLYSLVRDYPAEVADWLESYGVSVDEVWEAIEQRHSTTLKR